MQSMDRDVRDATIVNTAIALLLDNIRVVDVFIVWGSVGGVGVIEVMNALNRGCVAGLLKKVWTPYGPFYKLK